MPWRIIAVLSLLLAPLPVSAQEPALLPSCVRFQLPDSPEQNQSDLTLQNLLTAGWCDDYHPGQVSGGAERIILFRTLVPFQVRDLVGNYRFALEARPSGVNENELGPEILLPLNRRLMVGAELAYAFDGDNRPGTGGASAAMTAALQLVDTACAAANFQVSLNEPGREDLLDHRLFLGMALAGFRDLGARFGLQGSAGFNIPLGSSHEAGGDVELTYAVALTKTLTDDLPWLGHFTPFVELAGATDLGITERHTLITILPGAEWEVVRRWWLALGVEVPLTGPRPFDLGVHFSVIRAF